MNISKYIVLMIIGFFAHNSSCMFFTQEQIASAERKSAQDGWTSLSPRKKRSPDSNRTIVEPRQILTHDPHSALFARVANDYVQQAYANWGLENQNIDLRDNKGKDLDVSGERKIVKID